MVMGLGLGDFVLVMGEFKVKSATMNIDITVCISKNGGNHDAAFGMPSRPSFPKWRLPFDSFLGFLP